jgi:hypothetical protein
MLRRLKLRGATGLAQVGAIKTGAGACDLLARPQGLLHRRLRYQ